MKKILIVDDNVEIRKLVRATLDPQEFEVVEADNGEDAIVRTESVRPDIILMDIVMPGTLDGLQAIQRIKSNEKNAHLPIIILSGSGRRYNETDLMSGVFFYLDKPFSPLTLLQKIDEALRMAL